MLSSDLGVNEVFRTGDYSEQEINTQQINAAQMPCSGKTLQFTTFLATIAIMTPALTSLLLISAVTFAHSTPTDQPSDGNIGITATGDTGTLSFGNGIRITASNNEPTETEAKTSTYSGIVAPASLGTDSVHFAIGRR